MNPPGAAAPEVRPEDVVLRPERYRLLKADPALARPILARCADLATPFQFVTREADGLTLLLDERDLVELGDLLADAAREPDAYRVVTFTPTLPWDLVGFLAKVAAVMAEEGVPIGAVSAYDRDHLFVRDALAERTVDALRRAAGDGRLVPDAR